MTGCQLFTGNDHQSKDDKEINLEELSYVVIPYDSIFRSEFEHTGKYQRTNLSQSELLQAEKILIKAIEKYNSKEEKRLIELRKLYPYQKFNKKYFIIDLKNYNRQYIPAINEKGEKEIWINFFCDSTKEHPYWKKEVVFVLDGGNCYFNIVINLSKNTFYKHYVNGCV